MNLMERIRMPLPLEELAALCAPIKKRNPLSRTGSLAVDLGAEKRRNLKMGGTTPNPATEIVKRMISLITENEDCLQMPLAKCHRYPVISIGGVQVKAHRAAWVLFRGPLPSGVLVLHRCDNPTCINPDHLFIGTDADNMADRMTKGRYRLVARGEAVNTCKLAAPQVLVIREELRRGLSLNILAKKYSVSKKAILLIKQRKNWKHI